MIESRKRLKTKVIIENAMAHLLQKCPFDQITTVQLVKAAGISRSSFYTHYKDKYEMIERYQEQIFHQLEEIFNRYIDNQREAMIHSFHLLKEQPLVVALLSDNRTKEIQNFLRLKLQILLTDDIHKRLGGKDLTPIEVDYTAVYLTNAYFGVCQTWLARGTQEAPEEIADFLMKMMW